MRVTVGRSPGEFKPRRLTPCPTVGTYAHGWSPLRLRNSLGMLARVVFDTSILHPLTLPVVRGGGTEGTQKMRRLYRQGNK